MIQPDPSHRISAPKRRHVRIAPKLENQLLAYAAAAAGAGVGLIATSQPAEAKIVYTPANTTIPTNTIVNLDVNNDGIPDFRFYLYTYGHRSLLPPPPLGYHQEDLAIDPLKAENAVWGVQSNQGVECAAALPAAVNVGPGAAFQAKSILMWASGGSAYSTVLRCQWGELPHGAFLGLKFVINGQTHFGWAHVTMHGKTAMLQGYAYETVPNQPIRTGKTNGPVSSSQSSASPLPFAQPEPATLGLLAQGSSGLALWRRPEESEQH